MKVFVNLHINATLANEIRSKFAFNEGYKTIKRIPDVFLKTFTFLFKLKCMVL